MNNPSTRHTWQYTFVILTNLIPLYGVYALGWKVFDVVFLFWLENVALGLATLLRIVLAPNRSPILTVLSIFPGVFFTLHYGGFCYVHGIFVFALFGGGLGTYGFDLIPSIIYTLTSSPALKLAAVIVFGLQITDFIYSRFFDPSSIGSMNEEMQRPYKRIIILHVTIIFGGWIILGLGQPIGGLLLLIALKLIHDWRQIKNPNPSPIQSNQKPIARSAQEKRAFIEQQFKHGPILKLLDREYRFDSFTQMQQDARYQGLRKKAGWVLGESRLNEWDQYITEQIELEAHQPEKCAWLQPKTHRTLSADTLRQDISWEPLKKGGANFKTCYFKEVYPRIWMTQNTRTWHICIFVFLLIACALFTPAISKYIKPGVSMDIFDFVPAFIAIFFLLIALAIYYLGRAQFVMDLKKQQFYKTPSMRHFKRGDVYNQGYLVDIAALQIIAEPLNNYKSFELNLVLKDGERVNVLDHGDLNSVQQEAQTLAHLLGLPIWER